ncbi:MAG: hypothetical protein MJ194_03925 [Clostridia bacterium]|nr:hypothetical protein [Clostridia bacterium]
MKKRHLLILFLAALLAVMSIIAVTYGIDAEPGSEGNPLVTKLYMDSVIESIKETVTSLEARIAALEKGGNGQAAAPAASWDVIEVKAGKSVLGGEGAEIVLRSGNAVALDNGANGVSDLTGGTDLMGGTKITPNHLLLVPREDGRGIKCETNCWVMVLGEYTIN